MTQLIRSVSPVDGELFAERPLASDREIDDVLSRSTNAQKEWRRVPVSERAAICRRAIDFLLSTKATHAKEITQQMGRPISQTPKEIDGFADRSTYMIDIASEVLEDVHVREKANGQAFIRKEPLGVVFAMAAWNYPYLIPAGTTVPGIMAGNAVVLKHSAQTPCVPERLAEAFDTAGLPEGVFQYLHMDHEGARRTIEDSRVNYIAFTGSVDGGREVHRIAGGRFVICGLELGGKDPAYVRPDADIARSIENLVDGAFYNSGQSCCAIERIYVHRDVYHDFVEDFVSLAKQYRLGNPLDIDVNLGPMVRVEAANFVRQQISEAVRQGATPLIEESLFPLSNRTTPYLAPQVLVDVDHSMSIMKDETFGPVVGIMPVDSDEEAIHLMNDSSYGLTASVWTQDEEAALAIGGKLETGTILMNGCDTLDPALAWTGVKDTGCGCTLSHLGYSQLTRPKSFNIRNGFDS